MNPEELREVLGREAARIDRVMGDDLAGVGNPLLAEVLGHALLAGGKRVRPLLVLAAARLPVGPRDYLPGGRSSASGPSEPGANASDLEKLAIAFEYLHAASLLHDDVIDHAELRRGRETVNQRWGLTPAILAGDFLHARALQLAGTSGGVAGLVLIGQAIEAMIRSEFLQMEAARTGDRSEATYFAVLNGKTAALIAAACEAGALAGGGGPEQGRAVRLYGANLGLAFQIVDDLLDYLGDPARTGKAVGNDLQEGKMTLPLIYALARAEAGARAELAALIGLEPMARAARFERVREIMAQSGAFAACRDKAEALVREGLAALAIFPAGEAVELLTALAAYVLKREK